MRRMVALLSVLMAVALSTAACTGIQGTAVAFERVEAEQLPGEVQEWAQSLEREQGQHVKNFGAHTYVLVAAGQVQTGGWTVRITDMRIKNGTVTVRAQVVAPPRGSVVTPATDYPVAVVRVDATDAAFVFRISDGR